MTADFLLSLAQAIAKGLLTGMVYGLMALGLSVIFGVMRVVNFAHGEIMVVGMYLAWLGFDHLQVSPMLSLPAIALLFFFAGYALQRVVISPFIGRPEHQQFLLLLAIAILLVNLSLAIAGPDSRGVQMEAQFESYELGPLVFDAVRLHAALTAVVIAGLLWLFFTRTRTGKSIRAAADNNLGAQVVGLDVRRLYAFTFGIGAACVGAAGALMITIIPVTPFLAAEYTLLAFVIVIVGGLGSMTGALLGGLLIGVSEAVAGMLLQPSLKSMVSFGILILVLLLRPQGLFGKSMQ
ncbi:MAG: branched-chain amino acid ABC transporter permease [Reyranella sp.]|nr:branched-chain amino acid ABC transporter permease [Reyranella sp.]